MHLGFPQLRSVVGENAIQVEVICGLGSELVIAFRTCLWFEELGFPLVVVIACSWKLKLRNLKFG